ncbi:hypothetical protein MKW92_039011 [Papaver armeniacum]|nr:hypothetical protein MKW92_039011 [Papaver armeniacum]
MHGLFLLCSIISTSLISITLSLLLPLQYLYTRLSSSKLKEKEENNNEPAIVLYEGEVWHERKRPVHNSFKYSSRHALLDLDRAPKSLPSSFFSNHLSAQEARNITSTTGPVVYYCYELVDSVLCLRKCIAEETNSPWGERLSFVFNPHDSDCIAKQLHTRPPGDYFIATLNAKRVSSGASDQALFFWLMPHKALKLWWKNAHFVPHPRYQNPTYRAEALTRDRKLQGCPIFVQDDDAGYSNICG